MAFFPFFPQFLTLAGGTLTGPLTVAGLLTTQAGITASGGALAQTGNITQSGLGTLTTSGVDVNLGGGGLKVSETGNAKQGVSVLVGGTVTVANTSITASSRILVTSNLDGGTPGFLRVSARVVGTSFTITSSSGTDTSTVAWEIFEPG